MPGPPKSPTYLQLLRGNPGKRALRPEVEPDRGSQCPEPPSFLSPDAVAEWRKVAPELHRLHMLTTVDVMPLAAYCQAYGKWKQAEEQLAREAEADPDGAALTITDANGAVRTNPLVRVAPMPPPRCCATLGSLA
jgi:P27 family predicted phage terminase small subunit